MRAIKIVRVNRDAASVSFPARKPFDNGGRSYGIELSADTIVSSRGLQASLDKLFRRITSDHAAPENQILRSFHRAISISLTPPLTIYIKHCTTSRRSKCSTSPRCPRLGRSQQSN